MPAADIHLPQGPAQSDSVEITSHPASTSAEPTPRRPESAPGAPASVELQLRLLQEQLNQERRRRLRQTAQASQQLATMRSELEAANRRGRRVWRNFLTHVLLPIVISGALVTLAAVPLFHGHWGDVWWRTDVVPAAPAPLPNPPRAPDAAAAPVPEDLASLETEQWERFNGALDSVPAAAVPRLLEAVNAWLGANGGSPCWVRAASGEVSIVISSRGEGPPLAGALSRCADAVEHFTH